MLEYEHDATWIPRVSLSDSSYLRTGFDHLTGVHAAPYHPRHLPKAFRDEVKVKSRWKVLFILGGCALLHCMGSHARSMDPQFERYVSPTYPSALRGGKLFSSVRVNYDIRHDGTVTDIKITEQTDQKSANSALSAVKRWQFKPWKVTEEMPARIGETVHFVFDQERLERRLRMVVSWERRETP